MNQPLTASAAVRLMRAASPAPETLLGPARGARDAAVAAREFAGLFYSMILSAMTRTVPENPYFGGHAEGTFRTMWVNELGRQLACRRGDVLAGMVLDETAEGARAPAGRRGAFGGDGEAPASGRPASAAGEQR